MGKGRGCILENTHTYNHKHMKHKIVSVMSQAILTPEVKGLHF